MSPYIIGAILVGVVATVIAGASVAVNVAKLKFADNPPMFNIARIGIIWVAFIVILAMGTIFASSVMAALQANRVISTIILASGFLIAISYALRQKSFLITAITLIVALGGSTQIWTATFIHLPDDKWKMVNDTSGNMLTLLWIFFIIIAFYAFVLLYCYYRDEEEARAYREAEKREKAQAKSQARTTTNDAEVAQTGMPVAPGYRVIWRRLSPTAMAPVEIDEAATTPSTGGQGSGEFTFQQNNYGYSGSSVPRPHEPTLQ